MNNTLRAAILQIPEELRYELAMEIGAVARQLDDVRAQLDRLVEYPELDVDPEELERPRHQLTLVDADLTTLVLALDAVDTRGTP